MPTNAVGSSLHLSQTFLPSSGDGCQNSAAREHLLLQIQKFLFGDIQLKETKKKFSEWTDLSRSLSHPFVVFSFVYNFLCIYFYILDQAGRKSLQSYVLFLVVCFPSILYLMFSGLSGQKDEKWTGLNLNSVDGLLFFSKSKKLEYYLQGNRQPL